MHPRGPSTRAYALAQDDKVFYYFARAQAEAFRHCTTPSITFPRPSRNLSASMTSRLATASANPMAAEAKESAASFLSLELLWPKSASIPWTMAGMKAMPCRSLARKGIYVLLEMKLNRGGAEVRRLRNCCVQLSVE